jgi:hypothetical protein
MKGKREIRVENEVAAHSGWMGMWVVVILSFVQICMLHNLKGGGRDTTCWWPHSNLYTIPTDLVTNLINLISAAGSSPIHCPWADRDQLCAYLNNSWHHTVS